MTLPGERAAARDWHDRAAYRALDYLELANLDWTFACQHPRARFAHPTQEVRHAV